MHQFEQVSSFAGLVAITIIVFLVGSFTAIYLQSRLIKLVKVLYPDKKGDLLELRFAKDWLESMQTEARAVHLTARL